MIMLGLPINNNQALRIPWVRPIQRQRSNWSPTYILHLFHLEDTSLLFFFISESVKVHFLPHVDFLMLFIVYKQCARSRRVHIEDHLNRFEYCHPDNNYNNDSFGSLLSKYRIFCSITRCQSSFYESQYRKRQLFWVWKNYDCGRQYPFKLIIIMLRGW